MSYDLSAIAFIGLGTMGLPMAQVLAQKLPSSRVYAYDIVQDSVEKLYSALPKQVVRCKSATEAASLSSVILGMVPEGRHVRQLYLGPESGLLTTDLTSKLLIDCSTIDTATSIDVKPFGSTGAAKGTLTFMLGCSESDPNLPFLEKLLGYMGTNITACGGHSLGLTAKLCNNYCSGMIALATAETFNIAIRAGLDPRVLHKVFQSSTGGSVINEKWNPVPGVVVDSPNSKGFQPGFKIELMAKDMGLAIDIAQQVGARLVLAEPGLNTYKTAASEDEYRGLDSRVVYRWIGGVEDWREKEGEPS